MPPQLISVGSGVTGDKESSGQDRLRGKSAFIHSRFHVVTSSHDKCGSHRIYSTILYPKLSADKVDRYRGLKVKRWKDDVMLSSWKMISLDEKVSIFCELFPS